MSGEQPPDVSVRVKGLREAHGLSMRGLAELCELSPNAISLIERGVSSPNVSTLHRLATALEVPITAFFEERQETIRVVVSRTGKRPFTESGQMVLESLGSGLEQQVMDPFEVTLQPGAGSGEQAMSHNGHELVYCLEGELAYEVEGETYLLGAGDTLLFEARLPHSWHNPGQAPARFLMVFGACQGHDSLVQHLQS